MSCQAASVGSGWCLAGLHFFEGPDDRDADKTEQREPAEDVDEGPNGRLPPELLIEERLRRMERVGRTDGAAERVLGIRHRVLELLAGLRHRVENLVLM